MRALAWICVALALLAAIATASLIGLALFPGAPGWGFALVSFAAAVGFGALAVKLLD
jgi:hypothetical protein